MRQLQKKELFKFSEVLIIVLIACAFSVFAGISYGKLKYSGVITINDITTETNNKEINEFIKQYKYILDNYYDKDSINEEKLLTIALKSILEELGMSDSYSLYMDEDEYSELNINLNGAYEGLGIRATKLDLDDYILIVEIIPNSPASKLDISVGDYILAIDGKDTKGMTTQEFSQYVLNSVEKNFVLKLKKDEKEESINIKKGKIELESVESKLIEQDGIKLGYLYSSVFASNTYTQFKEKLKNLENNDIDALIIDLRSNSGGHLKEVGKILNLFLENKQVIYQLDNNKDIVKYYSKGKSNKSYPIIFISNEYTASASEVFIISLKENLDAKLVGKKTYGKGTVQELIELPNGDQYKITTKKWLSPKGNWINDTDGILPDKDVDLSDDYIKDPTDENDDQLQEAIKYAKEEIKDNKNNK